jgi:hypothetical protein
MRTAVDLFCNFGDGALLSPQHGNLAGERPVIGAAVFVWSWPRV